MCCSDYNCRCRWYAKHRADVTVLNLLRPFVTPLVIGLTAIFWAACSKNEVLEFDTRAYLWWISILFANTAVT